MHALKLNGEKRVLRRRLLAAGLSATLSGCSGATAGIETTHLCDIWHPVSVSKHDKLTRRTAEEIAVNNAVNESLCGLRPPLKQIAQR